MNSQLPENIEEGEGVQGFGGVKIFPGGHSVHQSHIPSCKFKKKD